MVMSIFPIELDREQNFKITIDDSSFLYLDVKNRKKEEDISNGLPLDHPSSLDLHIASYNMHGVIKGN